MQLQAISREDRNEATPGAECDYRGIRIAVPRLTEEPLADLCFLPLSLGEGWN